jgi:hypothetical protein
MLRQLADNRNAGSLATRLRRRRFRLFEALLSRLERPVRILDIGGTQRFWETMGSGTLPGVRITLLNLTPAPASRADLMAVCGDARRLPFRDRSFDVAFSNSVIEHVGGPEDQRRMAGEIRRVAARYFVQTPNRFFPIEPHFLFPGFQFLPLGVRTHLVRRFRVGWFERTADAAEARRLAASVRLLGRREFQRLFPDARLYRERILALTKSFVAYGGWEGA